MYRNQTLSVLFMNTPASRIKYNQLIMTCLLLGKVIALCCKN